MKKTLIFGLLASIFVSAHAIEPDLLRQMCIAEVERSSTPCMFIQSDMERALCVSYSYDRVERTAHENSCALIEDRYDSYGEGSEKNRLGELVGFCKARLLVHKKNYYTARRNCRKVRTNDAKLLCEAMVLSKALLFKENRITEYKINPATGDFDLSVKDKPVIKCRTSISHSNYKLRQVCQGMIGYNRMTVDEEMKVDGIVGDHYLGDGKQIKKDIIKRIRHAARLARCGK